MPLLFQSGVAGGDKELMFLRKENADIKSQRLSKAFNSKSVLGVSRLCKVLPGLCQKDPVGPLAKAGIGGGELAQPVPAPKCSEPMGRKGKTRPCLVETVRGKWRAFARAQWTRG